MNKFDEWHEKVSDFLWAHPHVASFIMVCIVVVLFGMFFLAVDDIHRLMQ